MSSVTNLQHLKFPRMLVYCTWGNIVMIKQW